MFKKFLLLLFLILFIKSSANANFSYNKNCIDAYKAIIDLKLKDAGVLIRREKQLNPQNGITILLDNYMDYFGLLASESKSEYNKLLANRSARISALEDNDQNSPWYLYSQGQVYLQWSFLKAKFGDYVSSAFDAKKAAGLLKDNAKKYPDFIPNRISLALTDVIFGSIPASFKKVTRFLGMNGNVQAGIKQLEQIRIKLPGTGYSFYNDEVIFFLCTIDVNVAHDLKGYDKLIGYTQIMDTGSLLKVYMQGYVAGKTAHNSEAITYLLTAPRGTQYVNLPAIDFLLGNAKLNRMDADAAAYLEKFIHEYKGSSLVKDTYLKLAYFYLLHNDLIRYNAYLKLVKSRGNATDEKDKQALIEANDPKPDIDLLKCRFYFDGGYYDKALAQIVSKSLSSFGLARDKVEYFYRLGRIYDKTGKTAEALLNYQRTINYGKNTNYYYAANAALNSGRIYEEHKDYNKAADYYNQTIDMKAHEYQNSIDDDAKQGLKRINK